MSDMSEEETATIPQLVEQTLHVLQENDTPLEAALQRLREVNALLAEDLDPAHVDQRKQIGDLVEHATKAQSNFKQFAIPKEKRWPAWFERAAAREKMNRLWSELNVFTSSDLSWPALKQQAEAVRRQLVAEMLPAFLRHYYEQASQKSRARDFAAARKIAQGSWSIVPDSLQPYLPADIGERGRKGLKRLLNSLEARQLVEAKIQDKIKALLTSSLSFSQAVLSLTPLDLMQDEDVPVDDLYNTVNELIQATKIEMALHVPVNPGNYVHSVAEWRSLQGNPFSTRKMPDFLHDDEAALLASQLESMKHRAFNNTAFDLVKALQNATDTTLGYPESDANLLIRLYWQTRWALEAGAITDPMTAQSAEIALQNAMDCVEKLALQATRRFERMENQAELHSLIHTVKTLKSINSDLFRLPGSAGGQALIDMAPLYSLEFEEAEPPIDTTSLEEWTRLVDYLANVALDPTPSELGGYDPLLVQRWGEQAQIFQKDLKRLMRENWPIVELPSSSPRATSEQNKMRLPDWVEDLQQELGVQIEYSAALVEIWRYHQPDNALEGLVNLYQKIKSPQGFAAQLEHSQLWLLDYRRRFLQACSESTRQALIDMLSKLILINFRKKKTSLIMERLQKIKRFVERSEDPEQIAWMRAAVSEAIDQAIDSAGPKSGLSGFFDQMRTMRVLMKVFPEEEQRMKKRAAQTRVKKSNQRL